MENAGCHSLEDRLRISEGSRDRVVKREAH